MIESLTDADLLALKGKLSFKEYNDNGMSLLKKD